MDTINLNKILGRESLEKQIIDYLKYFEENKHDLLTRRGLYIYGNPGVGKTHFVKTILKTLDYDIISFDAGDVRNKSAIDKITKHNMSDKNIMNLFYKKSKKIAIVMDEIDGMNSGDKGGINSLIKLMRPKKTRRQKKEDITLNPIICIGNYHIDKKIKEIKKTIECIEIKNPTQSQIKQLLSKILKDNTVLSNEKGEILTNYIGGDLRKLKFISEIQHVKSLFENDNCLTQLFQGVDYNDDTKIITKKLLNNHYHIDEHFKIMNDTNRTSVALLFHENIIDCLSNTKTNETIDFYLKILENICFSDYIDRITFQKQIWIFNEMSSLIKTLYNNHIFHTENVTKRPYTSNNVRFTKVLTKYSTEYNNSVFIQDMCQKFNMDHKDLLCYFYNLRETSNSIQDIIDMFEKKQIINKLETVRMYRYIDSCYQ
jgi:DNA polymerase III delta prime subunit